MEQSVAIGTIVSIGLVLVLLALGLRIYAVVGLAGVITGWLLVGHQSLQMLQFIPFTSANSWTLTALPLFVLAGYLCLKYDLSQSLYSGASTFLSHFPGGLLHANIGACAMFAAITGSPTATAATISSVALPELKKRGYDIRITLGSLAAGGVLGPIIPPSTAFIIIGSIAEVSIGKLFFGGLFPGIILALTYMAYIYVWARIHPAGAAPIVEKLTLRSSLNAIRNLFPLFVVALIVLGGIYIGIFTPTEAGAVACFSIMIMVIIMKRGFRWKPLRNALLQTIELTSFLMLIIVGSAVLQNTLASLRVPAELAEWIGKLSPSPIVFMLFVFVFYLIAGCLMDTIPVLIMTVPIFFPIAEVLGYDLVHFGVLLGIFCTLGTITPPVGVVLYAVQHIRGEGSIGDIFRGVIPFIFAIIAVSALVVFFPVLVTWLPSFMITR